MRWDDLFTDIGAQFDAELAAGDREVAEQEERARIARTTLAQRVAALRADRSAVVPVELVDGRVLRLRVAAAGADWLSGDAVDGVPCAFIIPTHAIASLTLPSARVAVPSEDAPVARRIAVGTVLRDLARRRVAVEVRTVAGSATGTIDRVGVDHLDLACHPLDAPRARSAVTALRIVRLPSVLSIRV